MDIQISQSKQWRIAFFLFGMAFFLFACAASQETPTAVPVIECPTYTAPTPVSYDVLWASSAHADRLAPAFTHWDEANPAEIPVECAQCHSWTGFRGFPGSGWKYDRCGGETGQTRYLHYLLCMSQRRVVIPRLRQLSFRQKNWRTWFGGSLH